MNRRTFLKSVPALAMLASTKSGFSEDANTTTSAASQVQPVTQTDGVIKLNPPDLNKGISIMQALKKRKTHRDISDKKLTPQQLSELLWAADGINRPDGKRTSPAAMAKYAVDIYVVLPEGVYLYDVAKHELTPIAKGDFRKQAGVQDFVFIAPVNLVYVLNLKNWQNLSRPVPEQKRDLWIHCEVGFLAQNVYLYCASEGLGATIRGMIDEKKFSEVIKVKPEQVVLAQTVGCPK
ncbi:MAG TPA: SagB/ThcOx family dehydrogenase [Desulfosporosinus sp.]|nr:SagB/ThcOx family dehydrogenase [Desulfosporosinus sp.]